MIVVHKHPADPASEDRQKKLSEIRHACLTSILRLRGRETYRSLPGPGCAGAAIDLSA
jgi:hypothetical protein